MKKILSLLLAVTLIFIMVACSGNSEEGNATPDKDSTVTQPPKTEAPAEDPILTGEKPELNILTYYTAFSMVEQPSYAKVEELTGYKINWFNLPQENPDEKLLLEISGGTSYDLLMRLSTQQANQLFVQNALYDLKPYLDKYGPNIYSGISEMALNALTDDDGTVYGMPHEAFDGPQPGGDPYGILKGGIGFNTSYLEELSMEIPTNLDELYNILKAYTDKTGKPALTTSAGGWVNYIMAGFGMGDAGWYDVNGEYLPRIKNPATVEYLTYMQKLYKEGLLDNDMPINTGATAKEKFTNGTTLAYPVMFWDIDGIYSAFEAVGIKSKVKVATFLASDANTDPVIYVQQGLSGVTCIPKTAKNPEHAVIWFNMISDIDNFESIYLGEEGTSFELKDGNYYPLFPGFADYTNADKFSGIVPTDTVFQMWQARARKTDAMAEMYEQMNSRVGEYTVYNYYESYAASIEAVQNNQSALDTMVNDSLIQAIVSGENAQNAINNIIAKWDKTGGAEYEQAMVTWYNEIKAELN